MANIVTDGAKTHAKDSAASGIKKTNGYIMIFVYTIEDSKKQDYQDQKTE